MSMDPYCAECIYRAVPSGLKLASSCDYAYFTGHLRGCPAGANCTKRIEGKRLTAGSAAALMESDSGRGKIGTPAWKKGRSETHDPV